MVAAIEQLNADSTVDGILVQLPLPKQINEEKIIGLINPDKDVDGFHWRHCCPLKSLPNAVLYFLHLSIVPFEAEVLPSLLG